MRASSGQHRCIFRRLATDFKHCPAHTASLNLPHSASKDFKYWPAARPHPRQLLSNAVSAWQMQNTTVQKYIWGVHQHSLEYTASSLIFCSISPCTNWATQKVQSMYIHICNLLLLGLSNCQMLYCVNFQLRNWQMTHSLLAYAPLWKSPPARASCHSTFGKPSFKNTKFTKLWPPSPRPFFVKFPWNFLGGLSLFHPPCIVLICSNFFSLRMVSHIEGIVYQRQCTPVYLKGFCNAFHELWSFDGLCEICHIS